MPEGEAAPARSRRPLRRIRSAILLSLLPGLLGIGMTRWDKTVRLEKEQGLDRLFAIRGIVRPPQNVCVVAIDDTSYGVIERDPTMAWPRGLHAELIKTLKHEGAKAVAFDVLFLEPGADPEQDAALVQAAKDAGNVVLGASMEVTQDPQFNEVQLQEPFDALKSAAARVADVNLPTDDDGVIRYAWPVREGRPGLALAAYEVATGDTSKRSADPRLLDFYGPPRTIKTVSVYQALDPEHDLPPSFFKDKIVFVGASMDAAPGLEAKDAFLTPYRGKSGVTTFGVEVHATLAANLIEDQLVHLLDPRLEMGLLLLLPLTASLIFMLLRPVAGASLLVVLMTVPWIAGAVAFNKWGLWLPTVIPSGIQLPVSFGLSLIWYYLTTVREREKIKRVFGFYLAPEMIRQIADDPDAVNLGGREIVGTAMFTDIKGFTTIAEGKTAPETSAMLNAYFSEATRHVFDAGGTLIKYIGDAVFAIWGAPIHRPDHATQACVAALALARAQEGDFGKLVTRIGVHTGPMLVGNLGSSQRFDYTAIGDAVNLASRIEGLNKALGTKALASRETLDATDGSFLTRPIGPARVVGRKEPVELHELIGRKGEPPTIDAAVLSAFARGLSAFAAGRFDDAAREFRSGLEVSGGKDGPSAFFADESERFAAARPAEWDGVVVFETK
jgi:adenylate cyclase